jgi:hypothetical protein
MLLRNGLLGLMALVAVAGLAVATPAPPIDPNIEGREPNPVIREFYETEKPVPEYGAGPVIPARSNFDREEELAGWGAIVAEAWEIFLDRFTTPLGTP